MPNPSPAPNLPFLTELARQAGAITLKYFSKTFEAWEKSEHRGIVTEADLASEKFLKEAIRAQFPQHTILAEESGWDEMGDSATQSGDRPVWLIDPVDGTTNFSRGNPYYCVSIAFALMRSTGNCDVQLGVVYQPTTGHLFQAQKGRGAYLGDRKLAVAKETDFSKGLYSTGIGAQAGAALVPLFEKMRTVQVACASSAVRINGAAALDLAHVAAGIFHGFWEAALNPWDTAVGQLLVTEAGGLVRNLQNQPYDTLRDPGIVASTPALIDHLTHKIC